ncbi:MAG: HipA family kinase [Chloroflexota bacterium]
MLRTVTVTRYVTPLREGGSLPAIVDADDGRAYVLKFRGAGQGQRALIAEVLGGEIGRVLGLPIPELVLMELDPILARSEPDPEIQALIEASGGINLGLEYIPEALGFDPLAVPLVIPDLAATIVWFDAYITNVDRTVRNPNLLLRRRELWLIDHGAALYFHHSWDEYLSRSRAPFSRVKDHVLLPFAASITEADARLAPLLTREKLANIVAALPDSWLGDEPRFADLVEHRAAYLAYLIERLKTPRAFAEGAEDARLAHL